MKKYLFLALTSFIHVSGMAQIQYQKKIYLDSTDYYFCGVIERDSAVFISGKNNNVYDIVENVFFYPTSVPNASKVFKYMKQDSFMIAICADEEYGNGPFYVAHKISNMKKKNLDSGYTRGSFANFRRSIFTLEYILSMRFPEKETFDNYTKSFYYDFSESKEGELRVGILGKDDSLRIWKHDLEGQRHYPYFQDIYYAEKEKIKHQPLLIYSYKIDFFSDFSLAYLEDRHYCISEDGRVYLLEENGKINQVTTIEKYQEHLLIIKKGKKDELWTIPSDKITHGMIFQEIFKQYAEEIKL